MSQLITFRRKLHKKLSAFSRKLYGLLCVRLESTVCLPIASLPSRTPFVIRSNKRRSFGFLYALSESRLLSILLYYTILNTNNQFWESAFIEPYISRSAFQRDGDTAHQLCTDACPLPLLFCGCQVIFSLRTQAFQLHCESVFPCS